MKKPVGRLLYPNTVWYFAAMLLFTAAAAAVGQYILAGGALFVTLIMFIISRARLSRRKRQLMSYVQTATDSVGISVHAGSAFPMAVIRLPENEIIWGNPSFFTITGLSDTACYQTLDAVVPGFSTSWLREGRSELPPLPHLWQLRQIRRRRDDCAAGDHLFCRHDRDVQRPRRIPPHAADRLDHPDR